MAEHKESIRLFEVGPRDGLQNQPGVPSIEDKIRYISALAEAGLQDIEVGAYVSPKWVPQMAGTRDVVTGIRPLRARFPDRRYWVLVPNQRGLDQALEDDNRHIAFFTAASESFNQKNINMSVEDSLTKIRDMADALKDSEIQLRAYVSTVIWCPYEGRIEPEAVLDVVQALLEMGIPQISLGETIGKATPSQVRQLLTHLDDHRVPLTKLAGHFHDTYGTGVANVLEALNFGLSAFDASSGGLGGCPYAPGAAGNVATEDVVYALSESGFETGVDLPKLAKASGVIAGSLQTPLNSKAYQALTATDKP